MKFIEKKTCKFKHGDVRIKEGFLWFPKAPSDNFNLPTNKEWRFLEYAVWEEQFFCGRWTMTQWLSQKP